MNQELKIHQILLYHDLPQIFIAEDKVDTKYLCMLVEMNDTDIKYVATSISLKRLHAFLHGNVELLSIFSEPEIQQFYIFGDFEEFIDAEPFSNNTLPPQYLPEQGFIYSKHLQGSDELISREVLEKNNAVVHLAISDNEDNFSIEADVLGNIVKLYQKFIENGFKKGLSASKRSIDEKKEANLPYNYQLRAFAASPSSFNLHLYSTSRVDFFGNTEIEAALQKFDEVISDFDNEENFIHLLQSVKGRSIGALENLLKEIIEHDIKLKHRWFAPNLDKVRISTVDKIKATKIYTILKSAVDLSVETREFTGKFKQVDVPRGTWRILNDEDSKEYNGEATREQLKGVTVDTVTYNLVCQEVGEELKVSEKEKYRYILQLIQEAK